MCTSTPPPTEEQLLDAQTYYPEVKDVWEARTLMLADYTSELLYEIGTCNVRIHNLQLWIKEQQKIEVNDDDDRGSAR